MLDLGGADGFVLELLLMDAADGPLDWEAKSGESATDAPAGR